MKKKKPVYEGKMKLKKGDEIIVLSGKDRGKHGTIRQTMPEVGKVIIDGINIVTRHRKARGTGRGMVQGQLGEMQMPMGISVSKIMLICPKCNKETRIGSVRVDNGSIGRKCRKCGAIVDGQGAS